MSAEAGRALAGGLDASHAATLAAVGWSTADLRDAGLHVHRDFPSFDAAVEAATANLPAATPVRWHSKSGHAGGFIVGFPGVGPGVSDPLPAIVVWPEYPAGAEAHAESWSQLRSLLLDRLDWLVELASNGPWPAPLTDRPGWSEEESEIGRRKALDAISALGREQRLSIEICGPFHDVRCAASIWPIGQLQWEGFADGWAGDGLALGGHGHPILSCDPMIPEYDGAAQEIYRAAVREGRAVRESLGPD